MRVKSMLFISNRHEDYRQALTSTILVTYTHLYSLGALSRHAGIRRHSSVRGAQSTALAVAAADVDEPHTYVRAATRTCR